LNTNTSLSYRTINEFGLPYYHNIEENVYDAVITVAQCSQIGSTVWTREVSKIWGHKKLNTTRE